MTQSELYAYARRLTNTTTNNWSEADLVIDLNDALSDIWTRIKTTREVFGFDDTNYTNLPSKELNLVSGQSEYQIVEDDDNNPIFTVHKVMVLNSDSKWVDVPRRKVGEGSQDGLAITTSDVAEVPSYYIDIGQRITFGQYPSVSRTNGIKVWFERAPQYFATGGTTFVPGLPVLYHKLIAEKAALTYSVIKGLKSVANLSQLVERGEQRIAEFESARRSDERSRITVSSVADEII